ncbi:MAG: glycosyltransferase family 4 protein [Gammaproteobacteria bacterium]|nr:glycosyltransferase family 4 protein [Gammaproteobacteria bacterium]
MKILIHDYVGHPFQVQLSRSLAYRDHQVIHAYAGGDLLTPRGNLSLQEDDPANLSFIKIPIDAEYRKHKYNLLRRRDMEIKYGKKLAALLNEKRPDVVISGNTPTEPQLIFQKACQQINVPFISWIQDFYSIAVDKLVRKKLPAVGAFVGHYYKRMDQKIFNSNQHIICITDDFIPILKHFGVHSTPVSVIPNWAPLNEVPMVDKNNAWASEHRLVDKTVLLYSGTLAMKHNPELLLKVARVYKDNDDIRVVVVSEGPGRDWLENHKREENLGNLLLLDFQPFARLPEVLGSADVLMAVLEPDAGLFSVPSKVLTYLCARRPILMAVPGENLASRIVHQYRTGLSVEPMDIEGFCSAARQLIENPGLRAELAGNGRAYAEKNFDIGQITDRFETIINLTVRE